MRYTHKGLLLLLILLVTACAGSPQVTQTLEEVTSDMERLQEETGAVAANLDATEARLQEIEDLTTQVVLDAGRVGPSRAQFLPNPPENMVTVQFVAEAVDAAIPGEFQFYLAPEGVALFTTVSLPAGESIETGPPLENGIAFVEPGKFYKLQVFYENPTDEEIDFLVPGGTLDPQAALQFVRNRCWCAAIPFSVSAGGTFSRIIEVGVGPDTPPGAKAIVVWPVVRIGGS